MDKKEKYMKEAYFDTMEEAEAHLVLAARIKESMDKTMKAIKREPQSEFLSVCETRTWSKIWLTPCALSPIVRFLAITVPNWFHIYTRGLV